LLAIERVEPVQDDLSQYSQATTYLAVAHSQ
jgi:hypothetical protein